MRLTINSSVIQVVLAGITFGIGGILFKIMVDIGGSSVINTLTSPILIFLLIVNLSGFYLLQKALAIEKTGIVIGISTAIAIIIPVSFGVIIVGEMLSMLNIFGIVFVIFGISLFGIKKDKAFK